MCNSIKVGAQLRTIRGKISEQLIADEMGVSRGKVRDMQKGKSCNLDDIQAFINAVERLAKADLHRAEADDLMRLTRADKVIKNMRRAFRVMFGDDDRDNDND